jgi:hypothetical protein
MDRICLAGRSSPPGESAPQGRNSGPCGPRILMTSRGATVPPPRGKIKSAGDRFELPLPDHESSMQPLHQPAFSYSLYSILIPAWGSI